MANIDQIQLFYSQMISLCLSLVVQFIVTHKERVISLIKYDILIHYTFLEKLVILIQLLEHLIKVLHLSRLIFTSTTTKLLL